MKKNERINYLEEGKFYFVKYKSKQMKKPKKLYGRLEEIDLNNKTLKFCLGTFYKNMNKQEILSIKEITNKGKLFGVIVK